MDGAIRTGCCGMAAGLAASGPPAKQPHSLVIATNGGSARNSAPRLDGASPVRNGAVPRRQGRAGLEQRRSEAHTSELQSLMRISYAVFCLTQKQPYNNRNCSE